MKIDSFFYVSVTLLLAIACSAQTQADIAAVNSQSPQVPTSTAIQKDNSTMNNIPSSSRRPPPPEVESIIHKGVRYDQDMQSSSYGGSQLGGYLVAIDPSTGERLWMLKVYEIPTQAGAPFQPGRYFRRMRLLPESDEIEIESEVGGKYLVNLSKRSSTWISGPDSVHK